MKHILVFLGVCISFLGYSQDFELTVRANQVIPQKKVFLEWINGRGQAIKVDSLLPNAQKQVVFKGKVIDQGGFYLINFFDVPNPQKVLVILEGGERVLVQADGINTPEKAGSFQLQSESPNIVYMNQLFALTNTLQAKVAVWTKELQDKPGEQARIQLRAPVRNSRMYVSLDGSTPDEKAAPTTQATSSQPARTATPARARHHPTSTPSSKSTSMRPSGLLQWRRRPSSGCTRPRRWRAARLPRCPA